MSSAVPDSRHRCKAFARSRPFLKRKKDELWLRHGDECNTLEKNFDVPFSAALRRALEAFPSIEMDSDVLSGTPRIAGTRIPVYMILDAIEFHGDIAGVLKSYPGLTKEQVKDALSFAGAVLEHPVEYESEAIA